MYRPRVYGLPFTILALLAAAGAGSVYGQTHSESGIAEAISGGQAATTTASSNVVPDIDFFGGYMYSPELDEFKTGSQAGHGLAVAGAVNARRNLGFVVDVDRQSWSNSRSSERITLLYVSLGPRIQFRVSRLSIFGMGTVDVQRSRFLTPTPVCSGNPPNLQCDTERSAGAFGFGVGAGADVWLHRLIAVRLTQINYSLGGFGEGPGRQFRIKAGVVIGLG
jgi:hypothetical protein